MGYHQGGRLDAGIRSGKGVIKFDSRYGQASDLYLPNMTCSVMYWQYPVKGMPQLILAKFKAEYRNGHLVIGGQDQLLSVHNAAIGRRLCPLCYAQGIKAPIRERDCKGKCSRCGSTADYTQTTYAPYFFYFTHQEGKGGLHIAHGSAEQALADEMKTAALKHPARDLMLPTRVVTVNRDKMVNMRVPGYITPAVFDVDQSGLCGRFGSTVYDFRVNIKAVNKRK